MSKLSDYIFQTLSIFMVFVGFYNLRLVKIGLEFGLVYKRMNWAFEYLELKVADAESRTRPMAK